MNKIPPLTDAESAALKEVIRNNLQVIHNFCEKHNLIYFLSDGTLLGAIRHKGMIPWDDDADICMPRSDYERLLKLSSELPAPYQLGHFSLDESYIYPFAKLINTNTEIIEYFGEHPYKSGAWVDIFPIDGTFNNIFMRKIHFSIIKFLRILFQIKVQPYFNPDRKSSSLKYFLKKSTKLLIFFSLKIFSSKRIFNLLDRETKHILYEDSDVVGNLYTYIGTRASHDRGVFQSKILVEFDGRKFYSPAGYDRYLKNLYGDYMTPPPIDKRQSHSIKILTLNKGRGYTSSKFE